ncbi:hypothetical protein ACLX1H_008917 [Fusarium chlamydosporum]
MSQNESSEAAPKNATQSDHAEPRTERAAREASLIDRFTWANFTCTQSTGGVALMLSKTPYGFHGLHTIGVVVFILNLVLFVLFCTAMTYRFVRRPSSFLKSVTKPPEAYFTGSLWLSMATIIMGIQSFGVPHAGSWLVDVVRVLFWIYGAITLAYNIVIFVVIFSLAPFTPGSMSSPMFLMIYNAMLTGTVASVIAADQPPSLRIPVIVAGIAFEGLGWILCLLFLPHFVGNLLVNGLGPFNLRPGLFISVGSAGYTIIALIGCAKAIPDGHGYFAKHPTAAETLNIMAFSTRADAPGLEDTEGFGAGIADEAVGCAESCEPGADDGDVAVVRQLPWTAMESFIGGTGICPYFLEIG